jgi:hypothetical protein
MSVVAFRFTITEEVTNNPSSLNSSKSKERCTINALNSLG